MQALCYLGVLDDYISCIYSWASPKQGYIKLKKKKKKKPYYDFWCSPSILKGKTYWAHCMDSHTTKNNCTHCPMPNHIYLTTFVGKEFHVALGPGG